MKKVMKQVNFKEFKKKRYWWVWVLSIFIHLIAIRLIQSGVPYVFFIVLILDGFVVFAEASHYKYILNDKFLTVKRFLYNDIEIPLGAITAITEETFFVMRGFGLKLYEHTSCGYKIVYSVGNRNQKAVIVSPKDSYNFMRELQPKIDNSVIMINHDESAFKRRKDKI